MVIAWWGSGKPPPGHLVAMAPEVDTIMTPPDSHWTKVLLRPEVKSVIELYNDSGEWCMCH